MEELLIANDVEPERDLVPRVLRIYSPWYTPHARRLRRAYHASRAHDSEHARTALALRPTASEEHSASARSSSTARLMCAR